MTKCINSLELLLGTQRVKKFIYTMHFSLFHFEVIFKFAATGFSQAPFYELFHPHPIFALTPPWNYFQKLVLNIIHTLQAFPSLTSLQH